MELVTLIWARFASLAVISTCSVRGKLGLDVGGAFFKLTHASDGPKKQGLRAPIGSSGRRLRHDDTRHDDADAVELFAERARLVQPGFVVAEANLAAEAAAQLGTEGVKGLQSTMSQVAPGLRRYIAAALTGASA